MRSTTVGRMSVSCTKWMCSMSGEANDADWQLHGGISPASMAIHGGRLYVACWNAPFLQIWDDISTLTAATVPDATMGADSNLSDAWHVSFRDDVMVVVVNDAPSDYKVNIYLNAGAIDGEIAADFEITSASMALPKKALLDGSGNLFVMDADEILIFGDATTDPYLKARLDADVGSPKDFALVE